LPKEAASNEKNLESIGPIVVFAGVYLICSTVESRNQKRGACRIRLRLQKQNIEFKNDFL
jgi:hypothetical protein